MPQCWDAKNKKAAWNPLDDFFYWTAQRFTNGLHLFSHHSVSGFTVTFISLQWLIIATCQLPLQTL